ncbi:MAG TPA: hypothetical protein VHY78_06365, partial [Stellaceae bacterium]|nr:hypothetical protein [Stellaceae bacterium]
PDPWRSSFSSSLPRQRRAVRGNSGFKHTVFALDAGRDEVVLRGLVPRIHVFVAGVKGVDGRVKPGQDEGRRSKIPDSSALSRG